MVEPFKDWEEEDDRINQSVNFEGVCRTALTTPGLLNMAYFKKISYYRQRPRMVLLNLLYYGDGDSDGDDEEVYEGVDDGDGDGDGDGIDESQAWRGSS